MLGEGAVIERLRRDSGLELDPLLVNSAFIYGKRRRAALVEGKGSVPLPPPPRLEPLLRSGCARLPASTLFATTMLVSQPQLTSPAAVLSWTNIRLFCLCAEKLWGSSCLTGSLSSSACSAS